MEGFAGDPRDEPVPEEPRPQRARKDTKHWCKGKVGREHKPELIVHHAYSSIMMRCHELKWMTWSGQWSCRHAFKCTACGKYTKTWLTREECPTWQEQQAKTSGSSSSGGKA